jgi:hypothetical protein
MANPDGESKRSTVIDRRSVLRGALLVGGVSALGGGTAIAQTAIAQDVQTLAAEREWARTLARSVADQLPEAARQLPDLPLSSDQLEELRRAFENTLVTNMGCGSPST